MVLQKKYGFFTPEGDSVKAFKRRGEIVYITSSGRMVLLKKTKTTHN